jgi:hypothetical protein
MPTNDVGLSRSNDSNRGSPVLTWIATIAACAYFVWIGASLFQSTPAFAKMFESLGVDLRLSTKFVIASFRWLYPVLFGGASALVVAKQFFVREKWPNLGVTLAVVVVVEIGARGIVNALYAPLFDLVEKINK